MLGCIIRNRENKWLSKPNPTTSRYCNMKEWGEKSVCRECEDSDSDFEYEPPLKRTKQDSDSDFEYEPPLKRTKQVKKSIFPESDPDDNDEESGYI